MKPPTVFLGEMTNSEVEAFLRPRHRHRPTGATEQHGLHGPLMTDSLVPTEVARLIAPAVGAVVAPPIQYGLSYPHVGFTGVVHIRIPTFMTLIEDVAVSLATVGFRRIVFLNGHYDNKYPIAFACANAAERLPAGVRAFPINYWDGLTPDDSAEFLVLHADRPEMSGVLGNRSGPGRPRAPQRGDAAVPRDLRLRGGPRRLLLLLARVGLPRDPFGHLGRRAWVDTPSSASALSRSGLAPRSACSTTSTRRSRRCPALRPARRRSLLGIV